MDEQGGERLLDVPRPEAVERAARAEQERLVEVVRIGEAQGEEPALDGGRGERPGDRALGGGDRGGRVGDRREAGDGLLLEELARGDAAAGLGGAGDDLDRQDRVAAELEEVVVHPHLPPLARQPQHLGPDAGEEGLHRIARVARADLAARRLRQARLDPLQRLAVELAHRRERHRREEQEGVGDHRLGQPAGEEGAKLGGGELRRRRAGARHEVGDQPAPIACRGVRRVGGGVGGGAGRRQHRDRRLGDARMGGERRLDLAELDAEAAQLDLAVDAPEELEVAVRPPAHQIAGAVETAPGLACGSTAEGVGHEAHRGRLRPAEIAAGEPPAADAELPRYARRQRLQPAVEHVGAAVGERHADRRHPRSRRARVDGIGGAVDRRLGGAVGVDHRELGRRAGDAGEERLGDRLDGGDRAAQRVLDPPLQAPRQLGEREGGDIGALDPPLRQPGDERRGIGADGVRRDLEAAAAQQGAEDLGHRDVEAQAGPQAGAAARRQRPAARQVGEQVDGAAVSAGDSLGASARARGEEDVGEVLRRRAPQRSGRGARGLPRQLVEPDDRSGARRDLGVEIDVVAGQEDRPPGVLEHRGEARAGVVGVERQVGAARLEHAQDGDQRRAAARQQEGDGHLRADAQAHQRMGQPIGTPVELPVGQRAILRDDRGEVRRRRRLAGEEAIEAVDLDLARGVVPLGEELLPLGRREERVPRHGLAGRRGDRREQHAEMAGQPGGGRGVEELGAVDELAGQPLVRFEPGEREVELRRPLLELDRRQGEAGQAQGLERRVLEDHHDLEERRAAGVAHRLQGVDQALERQVLMCVGAGAHPAHLRQEVAEAGLAAELDAQRQGVDEEADQPLRLAAGAVGDGRAHHHVVLPGVAAEQGGEGGEEGHEERRPLALGDGAERRGERRRHARGMPAAARAAGRRARAVERQVEGRRAGEVLAPVGEISGQRLAVQPPALPERVIGVLEREGGERRRPAGGEGGVERPQLAQEDAHRPAVGDDVVHGEEHLVPPRGEAQQRRPHERAGREVEGERRLRGAEPPRLALAERRRQPRQVHPRQRRRRRRGDRLRRPAVDRREGGAQALVAAHQGGEARGEGRGVERPLQADGERQVVGGVAGLPLVEEPEPLLGEGERQRAGSGEAREEPLAAGALPGSGFAVRQRRLPEASTASAAGHAGDRRPREEVLERHRDPQPVAQPRGELGGDERVAAQLVEVVVATHLGDAEQLAEEIGDPALDPRGRRRVRRRDRRPRMRSGRRHSRAAERRQSRSGRSRRHRPERARRRQEVEQRRRGVCRVPFPAERRDEGTAPAAPLAGEGVAECPVGPRLGGGIRRRGEQQEPGAGSRREIRRGADGGEPPGEPGGRRLGIAGRGAGIAAEQDQPVEGRIAVVAVAKHRAHPRQGLGSGARLDPQHAAALLPQRRVELLRRRGGRRAAGRREDEVGAPALGEPARDRLAEAAGTVEIAGATGDPVGAPLAQRQAGAAGGEIGRRDRLARP